MNDKPADGIYDAANQRMIPANDLDFQNQMSIPKWGGADISPGFRTRLSKLRVKKLPAGTQVRKADGKIYELEDDLEVIDNEALWDLLGFLTQDMRLGNLNPWAGELAYCQYYLELAHDYLQLGFTRAFIICVSRVATMLELSQSKGGFFRKLMRTLRTEGTSRTELEETNNQKFWLKKKKRS